MRLCEQELCPRNSVGDESTLGVKVDVPDSHGDSEV